jgi:hypothetical protein
MQPTTTDLLFIFPWQCKMLFHFHPSYLFFFLVFPQFCSFQIVVKTVDKVGGEVIGKKWYFVISKVALKCNAI